MSQTDPEARRNELHARLDALADKITRARQQFRDERSFTHRQALNGDELKKRYRYLKAKLNEEVADVEAHGHHVSSLEASAREWFDSLDIGTRWD